MIITKKKIYKNSMNKIGAGYEFNVFSQGDKVIKIPLTQFKRARKLYGSLPGLKCYFIVILKMLFGYQFCTRSNLKKLQKKGINLEKFGNPIWNKGKIEQDKVEILKIRLEEDFEYAKLWVDKLILFILECWKYGFYEYSYSVNINYGIDTNNNIVLIDLGEITLKKKKLKMIS